MGRGECIRQLSVYKAAVTNKPQTVATDNSQSLLLFTALADDWLVGWVRILDLHSLAESCPSPRVGRRESEQTYMPEARHDLAHISLARASHVTLSSFSGRCQKSFTVGQDAQISLSGQV